MATPLRSSGPAPRRSPSRRTQILDAAARLFAERGYHGVSIEDIGRAVGIRGPGIYRHFPGKDAVLARMLLDVSERLLAGGRERVDTADHPAAALDALISGHIEFALSEPALITVHDRELGNVPEPERRTVRRLQRGYVEQWVGVLADLAPDVPAATLRASTHAMFGLLNSTPYSARAVDRDPMAQVLRDMAHGALAAALRGSA
ncbi:MAG: TetR family transcriptional regulator [Pseudonocardiaceae bacterium]|nr:TetR family transcriptional regulator [Pseudonocardiaceae bacterium]